MTYQERVSIGELRRRRGVSYVDKVDGVVNLGDLLGGKGNHVALLAGDGDGELLVANSSLDLLEQEGVRLNLGDLARVGVLLVVFAIATRVFPVNIYSVISKFLPP